MSGNGIIADAVTVQSGGTIAAGGTATAVSTLNTGSETWNAGGKFMAKINVSDPTDSKGAGTAYDALIMSGLNIAASPGTGNTFTIAVASATSVSGTKFNGASHYIFPIVQIGTGGAITGFSTSAFVLDTSGFTATGYTASPNNTSPSGTFSPVDTGTAIDLDYDPSPEPTSAVLVIAAASPVILGRRRRA